MDLGEVLSGISKGKFRVFGRDGFDETFFIVGEGDYEHELDAIAVAQQKEKKKDKLMVKKII